MSFNLLNEANLVNSLLADEALAAAILGEVQQIGVELRTAQPFSVASPPVQIGTKKVAISVSGVVTQANGITIPQGNFFADFLAYGAMAEAIAMQGAGLVSALSAGQPGSATLDVSLYGHKYAITITVTPVA